MNRRRCLRYVWWVELVGAILIGAGAQAQSLAERPTPFDGPSIAKEPASPGATKQEVGRVAKDNLLTNAFTVSGGGFFSFNDTDVQLDSDAGPGTSVDLERDLKLDEFGAQAFGEARWRISPHHQISLAAFNLNRGGTAAAQRTLQIGSLDILAGVSVATELDLVLGRLTYGYSLKNDGQSEIGLLIGGHIATLDYEVEVIATIAGAAAVGRTTHESVTAPLPHIGFMGGRKLGNDLFVDGRVVGFYLDFGDDVSGWLLEADLHLTKMIWPNFGVGAGLRYFQVGLEWGDPTFGLYWRMVGPSAYAVFTF